MNPLLRLTRYYYTATRWPEFAMATLITFIIAGLLFVVFSIAGLVLIPCVWAIVTALAFYLKHKLGGLTGDSYGAINEVAEVVALVVPVLLYHVSR